jgi:hypothetical protein
MIKILGLLAQATKELASGALGSVMCHMLGHDPNISFQYDNGVYTFTCSRCKNRLSIKH